ncbi:MAG TPA: hypothetical protein VK623_05705 [Flavobacterium sp.]|nr:hypothetical protein [Flavobacterium sp.]
MTTYRNTSGNSNIAAYEIGADYIKVQFIDTGKVYKYSYRSAKASHVEAMKKLASKGTGLDAYISENINKKTEPSENVFEVLKKIFDR